MAGCRVIIQFTLFKCVYLVLFLFLIQGFWPVIDFKDTFLIGTCGSRG